MRRLAAALAALLLVGCVRAPAPPPPVTSDTRTQQACAPVMAALPARLFDSDRTLVEPQVVRWGSDIVVACGVDRPADVSAVSRCDVVNDIGWFAEQTSGGWRFTTIERPVYVQVIVGEAHSPAADALVDVADAVAKMPATKPCV